MLAVLVALAVRLLAAGSLRFDGLYGQDAFAYYYHGVALWRDHSLLYHWPWLPAPIRLYWPYGEPAQLALAFTVAGAAGTIPALAVSLLAGLGTVAALYALTLDIAAPLLSVPLARATAALVALLLGLSGLAVQASCTIMSDAPALFWGSLSVWLWHGAGRCEPGVAYGSASGRSKGGDPGCGSAAWPRQGSERAQGSRHPLCRAFAAGACLGVAFATRYEYALLVAPLILGWYAHPAGRRPHLALLLAGLLLVILPQLVIATTMPSSLLGNQWVLGWHPSNAWRSTFVSPEGLFSYGGSPGTFYLVGPLLSARSLPPPLAPCAAIGVLSLVAAARGGGARASRARVSLATLAGWWLVPALYLSGVPFESTRYTLILLPPLAILEALGAATTLRWLCVVSQGRSGAVHRLHSVVQPLRDTSAAAEDRATTRPRNPWVPRSGSRPRQPIAVAGPLARIAAPLEILWIGGSLGVAVAQSRTPLQILANGKVADMAAVRQAVALAPSGAHIATFGLTLGLYHYGDLRQRHLALVDLSAASIPTLRALLGGPLLVVVDTPNLAAQWAGREPERALRYLSDHGTLHRIRMVGPYTIFRSTPVAGSR